MGSVEGREYRGSRKRQSDDHSSASKRQTDRRDPTTSSFPGSRQEEPIQVDDDDNNNYISTEIRELLSQDAQQTGLEVDEDCGEASDEEPSSQSVCAMSMYPRVAPAFQVEQPFRNGNDSATM